MFALYRAMSLEYKIVRICRSGTLLNKLAANTNWRAHSVVIYRVCQFVSARATHKRFIVFCGVWCRRRMHACCVLFGTRETCVGRVPVHYNGFQSTSINTLSLFYGLRWWCFVIILKLSLNFIGVLLIFCVNMCSLRHLENLCVTVLRTWSSHDRTIYGCIYFYNRSERISHA